MKDLKNNETFLDSTEVTSPTLQLFKQQCEETFEASAVEETEKMAA